MDWNKEYFYHYTSLNAAKSIIESQELWFSKSHNLNDIYESSGPPALYPQKDSCQFNWYLDNYRQISLTMDTHTSRGFDIPAMWGHYASKGQGVCIVFDKDRILSEVERRELYSRNIIYVEKGYINSYDRLYERSKYGDVETFLRAAKNELFFTKTKDWEYEQEYRIIAINDELRPLSIKDAIVAVLVFARTHNEFLESNMYLELSKYNSITIYRYTPDAVTGNWVLYDINGNNMDPKAFSFNF